MNAPATFQRALQSILYKVTWKSCQAYLVDTVMFSETHDQHLQYTENGLSTLYAADLLLELM